MQSLSLDHTNQIIQKAIEKAEEINIYISIAIVDNGGNLKAFQRMDKALIGPAEVCVRKARTAALFGCDSQAFGQLIKEDNLIGMENTNGGLAAFPGGLTITLDGCQIGAIGVSGGSAKQDNAIASHAIKNLY